MNRTVRSALLAIDVSLDRIHLESYGGTTDLDETIEGMESIAAVTLDG